MPPVIWDLGGTLVDSYPEVDAALHEAAPGSELLEVATLTRRSSGVAIATLARRHDVPDQRLRDAYDAVSARWRTDPAPLRDGAAEVMAAVRDGGGLNLVATHRDRASAIGLLEALGVEVDDLVCAPDGWPRKPEPAMNEHLLREHALAREQVLAVGDRAGDVGAGLAAGIAAFLLRDPLVPIEAPGATPIDDLRALIAHL